MSNYIYLLREREFIKTGEPIFKVGMTTKENHVRFNQYPKGSILLFQIICKSCKNMETHILTEFRTKFKSRKDIGNEYFEGEYKTMMDIIYLIIKNEEVDDNEININDEECDNLKVDEKQIETNDLEEKIEFEKMCITEQIKILNEQICIIKESIDNNNGFEYIPINTCDEFIKLSNLEIRITNKKHEGYIRFKKHQWRILYDKNKVEFDPNYMETLEGYIEAQKTMYEHTYDFDVGKILQDTVKQCFTENNEFYKSEYHKYCVFSLGNDPHPTEYFIFNASNFTFTPVDDEIHDKILIEGSQGERAICLKQSINTDIVDEILESLTGYQNKLDYKQLMYSLLVKQCDMKECVHIFYDYDYINNESLLTSWITDILFTLSKKKLYRYSYEYYDDAKKFKKDIKINKPRCIIIRPYKKKSLETQKHDFIKLGFKHIIINMQACSEQVTYNLPNFEKYLQDNKERLIKCINLETNQNLTDWTYQYANDIFYDSRLFLTNFLKWCCVK